MDAGQNVLRILPLPEVGEDVGLDEQPEGVRRDFPNLEVSGAMYSERAADRMVVFNGQVFHEGEVGRDRRDEVGDLSRQLAQDYDDLVNGRLPNR